MGKPRTINPRQQKFIEAYLVCLNATQAAVEAGYRDRPGAKVTGTRLTHNPIVRAEIDRRMKAEIRMSSEEILARLERIATSSAADFLEPGTFNLNADAVHRDGDLIQSVWFTAEGPRLRLHDPLKALELLGKAKALFVDRLLLRDMEGMDIVDDEAVAYSRTRPSPTPERD